MDLSTSQRPERQQKRVRSAFTTQQIEFLEQQFKKTQYINVEHRKQLAFVLNIQERAVKIWFQNRRMKEKKDHIKVDDERNKNKESQRQLNNECAVPSANERPSVQVITKPVVVRSANVNAVCVKPKSKTNTVLSQFFKPSVNVNAKSISVEPVAETTVLSQFVKPSVSVVDNPSVSVKPKAKSNTVSSYFFDQYRHSSAPQLRKPTASDTTNKNAVSESKKYTSVLTERKTHKLTGNYNFSTKEVQNFALKNLNSKVKRCINGSESTPKTRKLSRSGVKITKTANVRKPSFVPIIQTMYTPISAPASVVWKPVNILSAPGTPANTFGIPQVPPNQQKKCCCNCTRSQSFSQLYGPGGGVNINNSPYHQYVLTLPFQNHSSCL